MPVVNMHEAKTHLAQLVRRVQQGETFIIARAGRPMAQLIRLGGSPLPRRPGSLAGVIRMDEEVGMPEPARIHRPAQIHGPAASQGPAARGLRVVEPPRGLGAVATPERGLRAIAGATPGRAQRALRTLSGGRR